VSLKIGEVAQRGGVSLQAIRYYEREGLLPKPPRLASGYRLFPDTAVRRVHFIKRAQELGFSLAEIRELLSLRENTDVGAQDMRDRATGKIAEIEQKIRRLRAMKNALKALADSCPGSGPLSECPILDALETKGGLA
jgi:MerR family mercuric resistance operon transcriptional regulator